MTRGLALAASLHLLIGSCLFAQPAVPPGIDELVNREMAKQQVPGLAVAVVRDGKVVLAKGYGLANVELQVPVAPKTVFQGGSIGKSFTATAVMMLVEEGKVALDEKVGKYLGEVPPSWSGITVRHLLTHTSGLTQYPPDFDQRRDYTEDELLKIIEGVPLAFVPGARFEYSNAGYVTLGVLIHRVTGQYYGDFFKKRIFEPLGMTASRVISEAAIIPDRAAGYILYDGRLINQPWIAPTLNRTADASLYLTVLDLAKWDAALYGETLLKRSSLEQMWTAAKLNDGKEAPYGFGWFIMSANGHRLIEHEGAWQGFNANISRYVDDRLTVIVMSNLKSAKTQMLSHRIAGMFLPAVAPPHYAAINDAEPQITTLISNVMLSLAAGDSPLDAFSAAGRAAFFPATAGMFASYLKPLGKPTHVQLVERTTVPEGRLYRYEFTYGALTLLVSATIDKDGKINALTAVDNY
ncbi:MAG TPA: serine hydrolase domain-containing protein [Thermoanaerobaculia bacterium]|nr:serine hydrolase domain-containing protein [Thermoanaerobaculia bacterium]